MDKKLAVRKPRFVLVKEIDTSLAIQGEEGFISPKTTFINGNVYKTCIRHMDVHNFKLWPKKLNSLFQRRWHTTWLPPWESCREGIHILKDAMLTSHGQHLILPPSEKYFSSLTQKFLRGGLSVFSFSSVSSFSSFSGVWSDFSLSIIWTERCVELWAHYGEDEFTKRNYCNIGCKLSERENLTGLFHLFYILRSLILEITKVKNRIKYIYMYRILTISNEGQERERDMEIYKKKTTWLDIK